MEYKITRNTLQNKEELHKIFADILKWNNGMDLILWPKDSHDLSMNFKTVQGFGEVLFNPNPQFQTVGFNSDIKYNKYIEQNYNEHNIFCSILYLENIEEEYISIQLDKLGIMYPNPEKHSNQELMDKQILFFETHLNPRLFNHLIDDWYIETHNFIQTVDFYSLG